MLLKFAGYGVFLGKINEIMRYATETTPGIIEIATQPEVDARTDDLRAITPLKQKTFVDASIAAIYEVETVSRTIYVETTGSDTTGDGSVGLPYLTIGKALSTIKKNINPDVTVTISIGVGTFTLSANDLSVVSSIYGAGTLTIQGTLTLVESGFTMGAAEALDPLTYNVSGGNTATWTLDQWKYYFIKSGSNYYPITHNALTPTISITNAVTGTEIYEAQTIFNVTATSIQSTFVTLNFYNLKLNFSDADFNLYSKYAIRFQRCYLFSTNSARFFSTNIGGQYVFFYTAINGFRNNWLKNPSVISCYFYLDANIGCISFTNSDETIKNLNNIVIENPNTGSLAGGIKLGQAGIYGLQNNLKLVNTNVALTISRFAVFNFLTVTPKVILRNTNYFVRKNGSFGDYEILKINILYSQFFGAPVTRWFYDSMYEFVNLSSGRNIQIIGLIYPEVEENISASLADNATTNVIIGNKLQNRSIKIDYTITRGTDYEMSTLQIIHDGTTLVLSESTPVGDDVGVTFAVAFSTNDIQLQCTLTSTGTGATLKYNVRRVMITPLTI